MPNFSIYKDYTSEVVPRLFTAGGVIGVILTSSTIPQVVRTSEGRIGSLSWATKGRMFAVITPKAAGYKAIQYGLMREMKAVLDPVVGPAASKVIAFGAIGTLFQSVIYNTLIADMYAIHTGKAKEAAPFNLRAFFRGIAPGVVWCFGREGGSMGGGLVLQPIVKEHVEARLREANLEVPEIPLKFATGVLSGAGTALATQWLHNITLYAGRMNAVGEVKEAPHYTIGSIRACYQELGVSMFYKNFPLRMNLIAGAVGLFSLIDLFHRPELRLL
jgi:hypothetical protein